MLNPDELTKAKVVYMILSGKTEEALQNLSNFYNITPPEIVVGTIKGKRRTVYAVYVQKESKIYAINSDVFYNPFVVLHEFYHHIRSFIDSYKKIIVEHKRKKVGRRVRL
jgi:hypothetical protein